MRKLRKRIDKRRGFTYDKLRKRNKRLFEGDVIKSESLLRMRNGGDEERKRRDRKKEAEETGRKEQAKQGGIRKWTRGIR